MYRKLAEGVTRCRFMWAQAPQPVRASVARLGARSSFDKPDLTIDINNEIRYDLTVIQSFADARTEELWRLGKARRLPANLARAALRKLAMLHTVSDLRDLAVPPGNRLEALRGDRQGQHSIRVNDQFRICFFWRDGNAHQVEIVDYH